MHLERDNNNCTIKYILILQFVESVNAYPKILYYLQSFTIYRVYTVAEESEIYIISFFLGYKYSKYHTITSASLSAYLIYPLTSHESEQCSAAGNITHQSDCPGADIESIYMRKHITICEALWEDTGASSLSKWSDQAACHLCHNASSLRQLITVISARSLTQV